jgi:putative transposase
MSDYRRLRIAGGCYFFTVNLLERAPNDLLVRHIDVLRESVCEARRRWPFRIDGWVLLPDLLHCLWTLPEGDADFATRWRLIKAGFARRLPRTEWRSTGRTRRDDRDFACHMDYVHFNPVKHGYVASPADWPHSTFRRLVQRGLYPPDWSGAREIQAQGECPRVQ